MKYKSPEYNKKYNQIAYKKVRRNSVLWEDNLKKQRIRYKRLGRKKHPNICCLCGLTFMSVRKDRLFCSKKCISTGKNNGRWLGGRQLTQGGYVTIYSPYHPYKSVNNTVLEHRLVMERKLGRILLPEEVVHHINGKKDDNRVNNLMLFINDSEHQKHHQSLKRK